LASESDDEGMFWCELLFADIFNSSHHFKENTTSNHFSKWVSTIIKDAFLSWFLYLFSFFLPINLLIFDLRKGNVFSLSLSHKKERERERKKERWKSGTD